VVIVCGDIEVASWPFEASTPPDLSAVDELCRLGLAVRRLGCSVRLRDAPVELWALLELVGLASVVTAIGDQCTGDQCTGDLRALDRRRVESCAGGLVVEVGGKPEETEEIGIEKGVEPGDPAV
jgi:hypothetical protein